MIWDFNPFIWEFTNVRSISLSFEEMHRLNYCSVLASHPPSYTFCAKKSKSSRSVLLAEPLVD